MVRTLAATAGFALAAVIVVAGALGGLLATIVSPAAPADASPYALADIPPDYLAFYQRSATLCPGLDWTILAAIGSIESDHGRSQLPGVHNGHNGVLNGTDGARGPMQFLPSTFDAVHGAHSDDVGPNIYDPAHAIPAAAHHLCDTGVREGNVRQAIFAYNHARWYVDKILAHAEQYRGVPAPNRPGDLRLDWPPEQATMPDPTTTGGRITPRTYVLVRALQQRGMTGDGIACFGYRPNPTSDHPRGRACDIFFDPHNPQSVAEGWRVVNWLITHQARLGIKYIVWDDLFWSAADPRWVTYHSDVYGCPNPSPAADTSCHRDHAHASLY